MSIPDTTQLTVEEYIFQKNQENKKNNDYMLSRYIGKPVIVLSNEIENLTVAIGLEVMTAGSSQSVLKCYDVVRNKEIIPMSIIIAFTEQKFKALLQINPNERIALFYNKESYSLVDKKLTQIEDIEDSVSWSTKVNNGLINTAELQQQLLDNKKSKSKKNYL